MLLLWQVTDGDSWIWTPDKASAEKDRTQKKSHTIFRSQTNLSFVALSQDKNAWIFRTQKIKNIIEACVYYIRSIRVGIDYM